MDGSDPHATNEMLDGLLGDFLDESDQLLAQLNRDLLQLDAWVRAAGEGEPQRCDEALLTEMFRSAHSLKGLSAMLGLTDINHLTHKVENVFDAARQDRLPLTRDVVELIFQSLDHLTAMVGLLKDPSGEQVDCGPVLEGIRQVLQSAGAEKKQTTQADAERALAAGSADPRRTEAEPGDPRRTEGEPRPMEAGSQGPADPFAEIEDEDQISDTYLSLFVDEAEIALDALNGGLLALEAGGNSEELRRLLGTAHKIKGSAASVGLHRAARLAHLMEDLLERAIASGGPPAAAEGEVLFNAVDGLRRYVADLRAGGRNSEHLEKPARDLLSAAGKRLPTPLGSPAAAPRAANTYAGEVTFQPGLPNAALKAQLIYEKLARMGDVGPCEPPPDQFDAMGRLECFRFRVTTDHPAEAIAAPLHVGGVVHVRVEPWAEPVGPPACDAAPEMPRAAREVAPRAAAPRPAETVRVDTDRLDHLMDLAGQLVINRAQFSQIGSRLRAAADCNQAVRSLDKLSGDLDRLASGAARRRDDRHAAAELDSMLAQVRRLRSDLEPICREVRTLSRARDSIRDLFEAIHQLDRVSDGIQKSVMDIRMVPVGPLFARFQRVVRDIARAGGKEIRLEIAGEKTELDKRMIDELGDPLVHLVRNAADHGIESPDRREAAGKPRQGTVALEAYHRGNRIVIEVRDDGRGLDADRILRKALDKGLVTEAEAARMSAAEVRQLIWKPGLSTADRVTDVSGRGMGMDIVKTKIEQLSGTVEIDGEPGEGTTIRIKLPLTLAILPSLMVELAGKVFAVPMEAVTEIVRVGAEGIRTVQGRPMATVRGRVVSAVRLGELLAFRGCEANPAADTSLVVVGDAGREFGMVVDRVVGEEDVVIQSIADNYRNVPGIAGAAILGNGHVALILDVAALVARLAGRAAHVPC